MNVFKNKNVDKIKKRLKRKKRALNKIRKKHFYIYGLPILCTAEHLGR